MLKKAKEILKALGISNFRVYSEGFVLTMDFIANRFNLAFDADANVTRAHVG